MLVDKDVDDSEVVGSEPSAPAQRDRASEQRDRAFNQRDRAAARRDEAADQRDHIADARDHRADLRDEAADERERDNLLITESAFQAFVDAEVQLGLLGSFSLRINSEPLALPMNAQRLVCFLALHDGLLQRQHVAGSLWGDTTERRAAGSLRSALWRLGHPTHPLVEVADPHLRLSPTVAVDVRLSEALAHRVLDDSQDLSEADLDGALLSMDLLPDWTEDWVLVKREYHTQLRLRALEALCRRLSAMGRHGEAVQAGMQAVSGEPLRESAQRTLITAHIAEGNVAAAVKQYDSFRELLRDELGLEPSTEMQTLVKGLNR